MDEFLYHCLNWIGGVFICYLIHKTLIRFFEFCIEAEKLL